MKGRKLISYLAALLCVLLSGCVDDSYRGQFDVVPTVDSTPLIPVWITIGDKADINTPGVAAKGTGLVTGVENFINRDFHVYAFSQDENVSLATTHSADTVVCLIDGSIDDENSRSGRVARWDSVYERVAWKAGGDIYWPVGHGRGNIYDFFAYYIDDMEISDEDIHRTDNKITIDVEIDGSQDLMSSKAETPEEKLAVKFPDEKEMIYMKYYCYSYYSAIEDIQPEFYLKHPLVKLDFEMTPGLTPGSSKSISVRSIAVKSKYKGSFTVADKSNPSSLGINFENEYAKLLLAEADGAPFRDDYIIITEADPTVTPQPIRIGGSLFVAPGTRYELYVTLSEEREDGVSIGTTENVVSLYQGSLDDPQPFEAGNQYTITMNVYGRMDVRVSASLGEWEEKGDFEYDHDDANRPSNGKEDKGEQKE